MKTTAMTIPLSIDLQNVSDVDVAPDAEQIRVWVAGTLQASRTSRVAGYELAVRFVDETESQALNKRYRDQDKPTNVLSFPFEDQAGLPAEVLLPLGDLVICVPVVQREAREQGKQGFSHWAHMVVHGTLHLLGHDHQDAVQAAGMEALEQEILHEFGIQNPYLAS